MRRSALLLCCLMLFSGCLGSVDPPEDHIDMEVIYGCTDENALNYNASADTDDASCKYPPEPAQGCMDPGASNYDANAEQDDGSCLYPPPPVEGCTDSAATNYDPSADLDDGSCVYPPPLVDGCTDPIAENYDSTAEEDDGSCTYPEPELETLGEQRLLVIVAYLEGSSPTESNAEIQAHWEAVGQWFENVSYGQVWFNITVAGPYELAEVHRDNDLVWNAVADDGYDLTQYNRFVVGGHVHTYGSSFSTLGIDSLNYTNHDGESVEVIGSRIQIGSPHAAFGGGTISALYHEMGHSFGLSHAGFYSSLTGQAFEYGTHNSLMGMSTNLGHFNAAEKARLGWLNASNVHTVSTSQTLTVQSIEDADGGGVRIPAPGDDSGERYYWLTARPRGDFTSIELLHTHPDDDQPGSTGGIGTQGIDATPETHVYKGEMDTDLLPGRSWSDSTGTIHITHRSSTSDSATVEIQFGVPNAAPVVSNVNATLVSTNPWVYDFDVDASDADGDELSVFWNLATGWTGKYQPDKVRSGSSVTFEYANEPERRVHVWVSDGSGNTVRSWVDLGGHVNQVPHLTELSFTAANTAIEFTSNASDEDACVFTWDYGDGTVSTSRRGYHTYAVAGDYTVSLTITDGEHTVTYSQVVNSTWPGHGPNTPPVAIGGDDLNVSSGSAFVLNASASYDPDEGPHQLRFEWTCDGCDADFTDQGGGQFLVENMPAGTWTLTLSVWDGADFSYDTIEVIAT